MVLPHIENTSTLYLVELFRKLPFDPQIPEIWEIHHILHPDQKKFALTREFGWFFSGNYPPWFVKFEKPHIPRSPIFFFHANARSRCVHLSKFLETGRLSEKKNCDSKKRRKKRKEKEDIDGKFLLKTVVLKYFSKHVCKLQITLPDPGNRNNSHSPRYIQKKFSRAKLPPPLDPEKSKNISPRCMYVWGAEGCFRPC